MCIIWRTMLFSPRNKTFNTACEDVRLQQHLMLAVRALYADVSPEPAYLPVIATTSVLFLEANDIVKPDFNITILASN